MPCLISVRRVRRALALFNLMLVALTGCGAGVERDFAQAAEWFEKAALAEYPAAQRNLGVMYLRGLGVKQDYHKAYGWLYYAHLGGNEGARDYLELMVDNVTPNASLNARKHVRQLIQGWVAAQAAALSE